MTRTATATATVQTSSRPRAVILHGLMILSGAAGLAYEIVWTRMLGLSLGHELLAMLAVIAGFFAGLAAGSFLLDRPVSRSRWPQRWYAVLEIIIGLWAMVIPALAPLAVSLIGPDGSAAGRMTLTFLIPLLLMLPATAAMGGTLTAVDRMLEHGRPDHRHLGGLYAANTLGAVAGTLAATFLLVPTLGYQGSHYVLALINFVCAGLGLLACRNRLSTTTYKPLSTTPSASFIPNPSSFILTSCSFSKYRLLLTLLLTGTLGIGYEVMVIRVLEQVLPNTIYTFASALCVYLLGTAIGAALYQRFLVQREFKTTLSLLMQCLAGTCALCTLLLWQAPAVYNYLQQTFGRTFTGSIFTEMSLAGIAFVVPTLFMGAIFSHLTQAARHQTGGVGLAMGINTVGAALASPVFGILLLPAVGSKYSLLIVIGGYLLLAPFVSRRTHVPAYLTVILAALLIYSPGGEALVPIPEEGSLIAFREGPMASVAVIGDAHGNRSLRTNSFQQGGTRSRFPDLRQGHLPILLHPAPHDCLYLGIGAGITMQAAADHPNLSADGVELLPEILPLLGHFEPTPGRLTQNRSLHLTVGDARRYVRGTTRHYDVIIGDLFHPSRDGAASLYTIEHFAAVRTCLRNQGLFCQWLPLYQLDLPTLRLITRSFLQVFPDAQLLLCHNSVESPILGLVGRMNGAAYPTDLLATRAANPAPEVLGRVNLADDFQILGSFIADADQLRHFAGPGPLNTDDLPLVQFIAPRFTYSLAEPTAHRLFALLADLGPADPGRFLANPAEPTLRRFEDFAHARDLFLHAMAGPEGPERLKLLRNSALASPDFADAYMYMVSRVLPVVARDNPTLARAILNDLVIAHPDRPQAAGMLQQLRQH